MTTTTRKFLTALVVTTTSALIAEPAFAHDYGSDLMCHITDVSGQVNEYAFANNSANADGSNAGTYVETGYSSSRKGFVSSPSGARPIWIYSTDDRGIWVQSRNAPAWVILIANVVKHNGVYNGAATLFNGQNVAGTGWCVRKEVPTAGTVEDRGAD